MDDELLVTSRQVINGEELALRMYAPGLMARVQRRAEFEVDKHIEEQGLQLVSKHVRWECYIEAVCQPKSAAATPVESV